MTPLSTSPLLLPFLLLLITLLLTLTPTPALAIGVDPVTIAHEPYQYFHSDGVGGSNAILLAK
ncbi:uncharacterized protein UDID_03455 [Ustilago sp. UG-2017a]|nr:uncharacterized protein UDID_03455 [Ustilago sp. UG-2017a]